MGAASFWSSLTSNSKAAETDPAVEPKEPRRMLACSGSLERRRLMGRSFCVFLDVSLVSPG